MKYLLYRIILIQILITLSPMVIQAQFSEKAGHYEDIAEIEKNKNAWRLDTKVFTSNLSLQMQNYEVKYYRLNLNIDPDESNLYGSVVVQGLSQIAELDSIVLTLNMSMQVDSVAGNIHSWQRDDDLIIIRLNSPVGLEAPFSLEVFYRGNPQAGGFGGFGFDEQDDEPVIWSLSEPYFARNWWPCKDFPNDKADSVDIFITVPENLTAVSNGSLKSVTTNSGNTRTFHWHEKYPITTYLVSVAITNYAKFSQWFKYSPTDSMEITNYIYPSDLDFAKEQLASLPDMLSFFHDTFGPYPFIDEKYGVAQFPWGGGMEHQTISSQGSFGESLNAHELAHQWFGDLITTANWTEIWMNEGFAAYSEALYFEHVLGKEYYHIYMGFKNKKYEGTIFRADTTSVGSIFNRIVYDKGAWVLHMLRHVLGDDTFFGMLKAYVGDPRFAYGNTSTQRFREFCEDYAGRQLDWFFNPWIYGTGRPVYEYSWQTSTGMDEFIVTLHIAQKQLAEHQLFTMPLDILLSSDTGDTTVTILNDQISQDFEIRTNFEPTSVVLDDENWVLKTVTQIGDGAPGSLNGYQLRQNYPNPFTETTRIELQLPFTTAKPVLKIYDIRGLLVKQMRLNLPNPGANHFTWDGRNGEGQTVASGVYCYTVEVDDYFSKKKMVYLH